MARCAGALAALALLGAAGRAAALGWNLQLNPGWSGTSSVSTDETGHATRTDSSTWLQRYRLTLDQSILPLVKLSAGGNLDWVQGTSRTDGVTSNVDVQTWNGFASLRVGARPVSGGLDYTRREVATGAGAPTPTFIRETYGASLSLTPADLPSLDLQVSRANAYDRMKRIQDQTSESAAVATRYTPVKQVDLRYGLTLGHVQDRRTGLETQDLAHAFAASYGDSYGNGRVSTYLNYNGTIRESEVKARGVGGTIPLLQPVAAGYSKVEVLADLPTHVTLNPNADLVDGNVSARAGLNVGHGATAAGDQAFRDVGAQFPNVVTAVNTVYVYVDRSMPLSVAAALSWTAYRSDDNVDWTPVSVAGPVVFDPVLNRFQIPIAEVAARYLKVVTRPLALGVTTDPGLADIGITEIQFYQVLPASQARLRSQAFAETAAGSAKVLLNRRHNLSYDLSAAVTHSVDPDLVTWTVSNGLGLANPISRVFSYAARAERSDSDAGRGHTGQTRWSGSLGAAFLPTLGAALSYSGSLTEDRSSTTLGNSVLLTGNAALYQGIALGASGGYGIQHVSTGLESESTTTSLNLSLTPNRVFTTSGSVSLAWTAQRGGGQEAVRKRTGVAEGSASFTPVPAFSVAGSLTRVFLGDTPTTMGSLTAGLSPFPGGDLQLRYGFSSSFDTASRSRTRTHGPTARWNIRRGWYLESGAQLASATSPAQTVETEFYFANLLITL